MSRQRRVSRISEPQAPKRDPARVAQGILIHHILQQLPDRPTADWPAYIAQRLAQAGAAPSLAAEISGLIALPVMAELLSPDGISEVPVMVDTG